MLVGESVENMLKYYSNNITGFITIPEVMNDLMPKIDLQLNLCSVDGTEILPITEDLPYHPINPYGGSKQVCEMIAQAITNVYKFIVIIFCFFKESGDQLMTHW
jgi:UDP-glucose 4-epimerase